MRLTNRTALITGSARGIGLAIAERFLAEGARVMLSDIDAAALKEAADRLKCPSTVTDVANSGEIRALVVGTIADFGHIDILVNNAGVIHSAEFLDLAEADFDRVLNINLKSAFIASQAVARHMVPRGTGVIINMSSVNAILTIPNQVPYAVSKGGLNQLTKVSAIALAPHGIRVNAIGPGTIKTNIARAVAKDAAQERRMLSRTPLRRFGEAAEVASIAAFLASEDASYLTGQTIYPDGGRLALNYTVDVPE
jgi:NAD(P)-dependent dehydrogenase (short-subunit alcohol dehydrogenase family)